MPRPHFDLTYTYLPDGFYTPYQPEPAPAAKIVLLNHDLAKKLGLDESWLKSKHALDFFSGHAHGEDYTPIAMAYAGHQFGGFSPRLGDGRAALIGEFVDGANIRYDMHLKGSGRTPYSRGGDGRAWLGPVLREYVVSEAMHALGVPTTRALAVVETGEPVMRETRLPGAVLTRVAASHLRVGTFQVFASRGDKIRLRALTDYAIARHYPQASGEMGLLSAVRDAQAELIAGWMAVGFIHGVMNTDNCAISGETIDYGPCAFLDDYHPDTVFSSIDHQGRYAYSNQPGIVVWNLAQLATSLIQAAVEQATEIVHAMPGLIEAARMRRFRAKLGLTTAQPGDAGLINELLALMAQGQADFTNTFRALSSGSARDQFVDRERFDIWNDKWLARCQGETDVKATLEAANPAFIARNHRVEQMIEAAVKGDYAPFHRLNLVLARPYDDQPDHHDLARPPEKDEVVQATFCGT